MQTMLKTLRRHSTATILADAAGMVALSVIVFGALHLPSLI